MKKKTIDELRGKVIDAHAHVGVSFKNVIRHYYPYAETLESLYFKQLAAGVDVNVVFPYTCESFCDLRDHVWNDVFRPAETPFSTYPYALENAALFKEVFEYCPELSDRFLPFVCLDPGRMLREQLDGLVELTEKRPVYGIKIVPILCQSDTALLLDFPDLFAFAAEKNIPFLFHVSCSPDETYSYVGDVFKVLDKHPQCRYCLAHCIGFHRPFLEEANRRGDVWVDTSALKIQVQLAFEEHPAMAIGEGRFETDYSNHEQVMIDLVREYPDTIIWGTDSPAYSYCVDRRQGDGTIIKFRLKGSYLEEKAALDALTETERRKVANENTLRFLFGA